MWQWTTCLLYINLTSMLFDQRYIAEFVDNIMGFG